MTNKIVLGLVGSDLSNSLSETIHREFSDSLNIDLDFHNIEIKREDFRSKVGEFFNSDGGIGLSVTSPFKQEAYSFVDILDNSAKLSRSVNCISLENNKLAGYNTDGRGFIVDLVAKIGMIANKRILILGSGGAVRGILSVIGQQDVYVSVWSRNSRDAETLQKEFSLKELDGIYDVVIHATSAQQPFNLDILTEYINSGTYFYDIQYTRDDNLTWFCRWAESKGFEYCDGKGMVYQQAKSAFEIWTKSLVKPLVEGI